MKQLKNCKPPDHTSKVNARVVAKLKFYEELMWVLQQQPCYMASLSACGLNGETAVTFNNIVNCVYAELEDPRTLHLFMAMLKLMIDKEVELVKDLDELFPVDASLVYSVFSGFALKPHHYQEVVWPFMDASIGSSLFAEVVELSKAYTQFALDRKEFAQLTAKEGDEKQSAAEEIAEFMIMLGKLKDFMLNQF